jgi:hypothetical protein
MEPEDELYEIRVGKGHTLYEVRTKRLAWVSTVSVGNLVEIVFLDNYERRLCGYDELNYKGLWLIEGIDRR